MDGFGGGKWWRCWWRDLVEGGTRDGEGLGLGQVGLIGFEYTFWIQWIHSLDALAIRSNGSSLRIHWIHSLKPFEHRETKL
jgi:hypothetical protein